MHAPALRSRLDLREAPNFSLKALLGSGVFHLFIVLVFAMGMPFVKKEPMTISNPISVEIADIDELTQTDRVPSFTEMPKEQPPQETEPPPPEAYKPPPMTAEAPPDLSSPKAPDASEAVEDVPPPPAPEPLERKDIKKPEEQKKPPPPAPKPATKKPEKPKEKANDFQTLLKNLTPNLDESVAKNDSPELESQPDKPSPQAPVAARITVSEEEALRAQMAKCWNVLAGAKYAENLVVEVRVIVNPDRTVNSARVINEGLNAANPHYRAAADAALRALRNPRCSPLALPPDKYESWKVTVIRFDPREML